MKVRLSTNDIFPQDAYQIVVFDFLRMGDIQTLGALFRVSRTIYFFLQSATLIFFYAFQLKDEFHIGDFFLRIHFGIVLRAIR